MLIDETDSESGKSDKTKQKCRRFLRAPPRYNTGWESIPAFKGWVKVVANQPAKVECRWCRIVLWAKKSTLHRHTNSKKHQEFVKVFDLQSKSKQATIHDVSQKFVCNPIWSAEAKLSLFIAEHCAVSTVDHLSELIRSTFGDSKMSQVKLKRTKCAAIIVNVLAPHFLSNLVNDMENNPYSLILDESTDISVKKLLGVVVRFTNVKQKKVTSTFLGLVELKDATSVSICDATESLLYEVGLKSENCVGIGSDNASVMTGSKHESSCEAAKPLEKELSINSVRLSLYTVISKRCL